MLLDHFGVTSGGRRMEDMTPARVAELPKDARPHVYRLKAHYDAVTQAFQRGEAGHLQAPSTSPAAPGAVPSLRRSRRTCARSIRRRVRLTASATTPRSARSWPAS
jgi:hypothetical protein